MVLRYYSHYVQSMPQNADHGEHGRNNGNRQSGGHQHGRGQGKGHGGGQGHGPGKGHGSGQGRRGRRRNRVRDEDGQFVETANEDDVLGVFSAVDGPVVTTTDVSELLGITTEAARQKLNGLVTTGELRRRKTGRTVVYWRTEGEEK